MKIYYTEKTLEELKQDWEKKLAEERKKRGEESDPEVIKLDKSGHVIQEKKGKKK